MATKFQRGRRFSPPLLTVLLLFFVVISLSNISAQTYPHPLPCGVGEVQVKLLFANDYCDLAMNLPDGSACSDYMNCASYTCSTEGKCVSPDLVNNYKSCSYSSQCVSSTGAGAVCARHLSTSPTCFSLPLKPATTQGCVYDYQCGNSQICVTSTSGSKTCSSKGVSVNGFCYEDRQCIDSPNPTSCIANKCLVDDYANVNPINLAIGKSCNYNYQCLSNTCDSSKHCALATYVNMINGGSCSTNSNCASNYCASGICADPNAPDYISGIGGKCDQSINGVNYVCRSNLNCINKICIVPGNEVAPCKGLDPTCLLSDTASNIGEAIGDSVSGVIGGATSSFVSGVFGDNWAWYVGLVIIGLILFFVIKLIWFR